MKKIHKFGPLTNKYDCTVEGRIVHCGMQGYQMYVWAEQDEVNLVSKVMYTSTDLPYDGEYVGTVIERGNSFTFVWHVIRQC